MSLADELLADLEEMEHGGDDLNDEEIRPSVPKTSEKEANEEYFAVPLPKIITLQDVCKLQNSERLKNVLEEVEKYSSSSRNAQDIQGPLEADPEYQLTVEANNLAVEIDNDIGAVHKYIRDLYAKRFSELESLVVNPLEYITTVKELGNDIAHAKHNQLLQQTLTQAKIMVVSVTASTTQGKPLESVELDRVMEACNIALDLDKCKSKIYAFVESRMAFIAPNLSILVGAPIAAKLMGKFKEEICPRAQLNVFSLLRCGWWTFCPG